jgi:hypothetical protein
MLKRIIVRKTYTKTKEADRFGGQPQEVAGGVFHPCIHLALSS